jgi:NAD+ diphosphatase
MARHRHDAGWLDAAWRAATTRFLVLSTTSMTRVTDSGGLALAGPAGQLPDELVAGSDRVLLGTTGDGSVYFALLARSAEATAGLAGRWAGLRDVALGLDDLDTGLLTTAVALQQWHQRHPRCPRCGAPTVPAQAGWTRVCAEDSSEHFPRTDPAVIMLITDDEDRCLLARGPAWPEGRLSVLAGFVEAGESAEAAVVREVAEEVGLAVRNIRYMGSQPHPFPASLMLGFCAEVDGDPTLHPDSEEIVQAGWFTRDQVRAAADWGEEPLEAAGELRALPTRMSIARQLIDSWLAADPGRR